MNWRYHIFDPTFPRKSKTAGFYCDCGMETREVSFEEPRLCNLATLRRAHLKCRCPLYGPKDIKPKTGQMTLNDYPLLTIESGQ